jgi:two-component system, NarL family, response regulator LiaR
MDRMGEPIRILLVDDHVVVREGLCALLGEWPEFQVVGQAGDGEQAVRQAKALRPDVILMDLVMPHKDGVAAIMEIKEEDPDARILVLTSFSEDRKAYDAVKAGALGYVLKDSSSDEVIEAIRDVYRGELALKPSLALRVIRELGRPSSLPPAEEPLTDREVEVLQLVAQGLSNREIGDRLKISERTVRSHVSSFLEKLHLANRTQAALYALREGLASLDAE